MMGSKTGGRNDESPVQKVTIQAFSLGAYEVTFEEYDQFAASTTGELPDDNGWGRGRRPVINVSWEQATAYAAWLSEMTGKRYRLATEAEWEYVARAGTTSDYYWGKEDPNGFAWYYQNSESQAHPVGEKDPNAFILYDMSGNVWEWVQDCYENKYKPEIMNGSAWEAQNCPRRVVRGGSWNFRLNNLRSATRSGSKPDYSSYSLGFRLARD